MEFMPSDEFQRLSIIRHSIQIPKSSPKTFFQLTIIFILPLSILFLVQSHLLHPLVEKYHPAVYTSLQYLYHYYIVTFFYQLMFLLPLYIFILLSTSASVFIVASIYTFKATTFSAAISALPRLLPRVSLSFLWISAFMLFYQSTSHFLTPVTIIKLSKISNETSIVILILLSNLLIMIHLYVISVPQLATILSVLESACGLAAIKRSREPLRGNMWNSATLVFWYLLSSEVMTILFDTIVLEDGASFRFKMWVRITVGVVLLTLMVVLILVGLLVQSVFYYVCKSYHHETIDKNFCKIYLDGMLSQIM